MGLTCSWLQHALPYGLRLAYMHGLCLNHRENPDSLYCHIIDAVSYGAKIGLIWVLAKQHAWPNWVALRNFKGTYVASTLCLLLRTSDLQCRTHVISYLRIRFKQNTKCPNFLPIANQVMAGSPVSCLILFFFFTLYGLCLTLYGLLLCIDALFPLGLSCWLESDQLRLLVYIAMKNMKLHEQSWQKKKKDKNGFL